MKSIILKNEKSRRILLCEDGSFRSTIFHKGKEVANEVYYDKHFASKITSLAICVALIVCLNVFQFPLLGGGDKNGSLINNSPAYSVYVDVNPSIVIDFDEKDKAIGKRALNEDGEKIVQKITLGVEKEKAIKSAFYAIKDEGFNVEKNYQSDNAKAYLTIASSKKMVAIKKHREIANYTKTLAVKTFIANDKDAIRAEKQQTSIAKLFIAKKIAGELKYLNEKDLIAEPVSTLSKYEKQIDKSSIDPDLDEATIVNKAEKTKTYKKESHSTEAVPTEKQNVIPRQHNDAVIFTDGGIKGKKDATKATQSALTNKNAEDVAAQVTTTISAIDVVIDDASGLFDE